MRKLVLAVMAIAAIGFTSCNGSKTGQGPAIDSTSIIGTTDATEQATVEADNLTAELAEKIAANNPEAVQAIIEKAKEKIAEFLAKGDTEAANIYQEKISTFLTENADKIKAVVGTNAAVTALVDGIANLPSDSVEKLTGATEALKALGIDAGSLVKNAAADAVEGAADAVENVKDAAKETVENAKDAVVDKANEAVQDAKDKAGEAVDKGAAAVKKGLGL